MKRKLLTLAVLVMSVVSLTAQNYVTLHEDCNYRGRNYYLEAGTYRTYQMKIGNDKLSSLQVPSGYRVTIYEDDNFRGQSQTYSEGVSCLDSAWNDRASSIVVENTNYQQTNPNEYVVFYNDCYSRGFSRSLRPGVYKGGELGELKNNISSFSIYGNLQVRVYTGNEEATGYYSIFKNSETCLGRNFNDRISSLVIEYKPYSPVTPGSGSGFGDGAYALFYSDCNYEGNALRLQPGRYNAEQLGILKYSIASLQLPAGFSARAYAGENGNGPSVQFTNDMSCLNYDWKNKIGSLVVEQFGGSTGQPVVQHVMIYTDANYKGQAVTLLPGTYATMAQANGFPDKALSSLQLPPGYRVVLYEGENFRGKTYTITASRSNFALTSWNDRTSSIKVYRE
ncbi:MAG: hypothetical protein HYZ15_16285 [Sphingobacteriales bacterium]|nr:hypothetical protein [Sphingobacteriales bacterium]